MGLGVVAGGLLTSCSNEFEPSDVNSGSMLVKAPKVVAYSGDHFWNGYGTRGANVNGNLWYQEWDRPTNVTEEEIQKVLEEASKVRKGIKNDVVIPFENYWVQQVWTGTTEYTDGYGNNIGTGSSHMNHLLAYNQNYQEEIWWPEHIIKEGGYEHINNFNNGSNNTEYTDDETREKFIGTTLMTGMSCPSDNFEQFGYHNSTDSKNHFEYIVLEIDGEYYVCFDFYATHPEGQDANKNMDVERDWVFNDWIVKITPAYHKGQTPTDPNPGNGDDDNPGEDKPKCDECGHPSHDSGNCEDPDCDSEVCNPQDGDSEVGETPETPETPGDNVNKGFDEVEINLSLDNKDADDIRESHLSMHVRSATDVKVFIPVPKQYYCEADDMAIVLDHTIEFVHGGPYVTEYNINGNIVTLNVEFSEEGITIWTDGITQDVIDYCFETYGDGITFEVWNYFNDPETGNPLLSIEELKWYLNHSTVEFLDKIPGQYINSFGKDHGRYENDGSSDGNDFHVGPTAQQAEFDGPEQGAHLNGSDNNDIYTKK